MIILVNAISLNSAGGLSVGMNFLKSVAKIDQKNFYIVLAPPDCGYDQIITSNIKIFEIRNYNNLLYRFVFDHYIIKRKLKLWKVDVVFSMGNIAFPVKAKQMLLFHWPYAAYPDSEVWLKMGFKERVLRIIRKNQITTKFKYAQIIAVQTNTIKQRLDSLYHVKNKTVIIPNAVSLNSSVSNHFRSINDLIPNFKIERNYLLCLSRYYIHKNIEVLIDVARLLKKNNKNIAIIITIEEDQGKGAISLLKKIKELELEEYIINVGKVRMEEVPLLYRISKGMILPTLLESFSGTYVESMYFQKPIFTSDLDFAKEICQDYAFYFNPYEPLEIYNCITSNLENKNIIEAKTVEANKLIRKFPSWEEVAEMYIYHLVNIK